MQMKIVENGIQWKINRNVINCFENTYNFISILSGNQNPFTNKIHIKPPSKSVYFIRFIEHFGDIMSGIIFVTFFISILWICTSLYQIHAVSVVLARYLNSEIISFIPFIFSLSLSLLWTNYHFYLCFAFRFSISCILHTCCSKALWQPAPLS